MKLVSFQQGNRSSYGVVTEQGLVDLGRRFAEEFPDLKSFVAGGLEQLPAIVATETGFSLVALKNGLAEYELQTSENGGEYAYKVLFIKDKNGLWMIGEF